MSFNPHPSRRTGATNQSQVTAAVESEFQSSPVPKDGCNAKRVVISRTSSSFNPHPSRRTGATLMELSNRSYDHEFQSSPVPKDGCNAPRPQ